MGLAAHERVGELVEGERARALHEDRVARPQHLPKADEGLAAVGRAMDLAQPGAFR